MLFHVGAMPIINCATDGTDPILCRAQKREREGLEQSKLVHVLEKSYANFAGCLAKTTKRDVLVTSENAAKPFHGKNLVFSSDVGNRHESRLPQIGTALRRSVGRECCG